MTDQRSKSLNHTVKNLYVVGTGIKAISHLSNETIAHISQSDLVLYLVNEPATEEWICKNASNFISLSDLYQNCLQRKDSYKHITKFILDQLKTVDNLCVVMYGHPTVFAQPAMDAAKTAKKNELAKVHVYPAISAADCLFADFNIDPSDIGCQFYEATNLIVYKRHVDKHCHLLIWQIGMIGITKHEIENPKNIHISLLKDYLLKFYPPEQQIFIYEASQYPHIPAKIQSHQLSKLTEIETSWLSTLYIPPLEISKDAADQDVLSKLGINILC